MIIYETEAIIEQYRVLSSTNNANELTTKTSHP